MTKAIRYHETGGPEVLRWEDIKLDPPKRGQIQMRVGAVGVNFLDLNLRAARYGNKPKALPYIPGLEAVGVVTRVGEGVTNVREGQRVCYASGDGHRTYAEEMVFAADCAVPVPDSLDDRTVASSIFKGYTAHMLVKQVRELKAGETVLVHGASGGIPHIVCQWAKHIGARVIGTVSSEKKAEFARAHGCDEVIDYVREDFSKRARELTGGKGVDIVYDGVGKAVIDGSLACLATRGMLINYGQTSGLPSTCDINFLGEESLYVTRPRLHDFIVDEPSRLAAAKAVFDVVAGGHVKVAIGSELPLKEAAASHRERERRTVMGTMILVP